MVKIKKIEEINFRYNLAVYWSFLKKYKLLLAIIMVIVLINSVTHIVDKFLFKVVIDRGEEFLGGSLGSEIFISILLALALGYGINILFRITTKWAQIHFVNHLDSRVILDLKRRFFNHILHLSHTFHTTHKTGSLIARLIRGAGSIERMNDFIIFNTVPLVFQLILVGASLLYFDVSTALVVLVAAFVFITYSLYMQQIQRKANIAFNNAEDVEKANISDIFTNIDSIKYFGKEMDIRRRYARLTEKTRSDMMKFWNHYRWLDAGQNLIMSVGTFLLIFFPILRLLQGEITIGTLVFIYTIYGNIFGPLYGFVHGMRGFYRSMADFESLFQYERIGNDIEDKPNAKDSKIEVGEVEFKNVTFNYGKRHIFKNFNLKINKNEKVALVGHSGSGKTTLVKLLYRLYNLDGGKILIDGKNIDEFKQEFLRSELSIVPQECILFDDTIYNNVAFSNPEASREDVMKAMKFAQLDKFVAELPRKEKTIVGERGVRLSGGEKQRVSIARAILADKKILVLDEATSSLDSKTEHEIQKDLQKLMEGRTSIIIAHRLSTIMKADKIVVMHKGKIVQLGKHRDLIKQKGVYRELWELQKGGYIE